VREPAFVMTSANPPEEPIVIGNEEAEKKLGSVVDFFLLHNRTIAQRCDDSVVRLHQGRQAIIRRSRGYAPEPIRLRSSVDRCALGVGAELMVTSCILLRDKAFLSQHVGDVEKLETFEFLEETIRHLIRLTNSQIETIGCDLHPDFNTTRLARKLSNEFECEVVPVQHHYAHIASLLCEHNVQEMVGIACDGFGYGSDGSAWGGEILYCNTHDFERLGHLQEQPMIGGDLATRNPIRMAAGILYSTMDIEDWLFSKSEYFPHGKREIEIVIKQLRKKSAIKTTSCGRILDAISAILGVCCERTYEGEPAIKLESAAVNGKDVLDLEPRIEGRILNTTTLAQSIFSERDKHLVSDLAYSAQAYLAKGLAQLAVNEAERLNINDIGFSGGVAYNEHITLTIRKEVEKSGLTFLVHERVPAGDGCIALGQALVATHFKGNQIGARTN